MGHPEQSRIRLRGSARTSTGQVRQNNEDNIHLWSHEYSLVAIVADGMGGAAAGEEASRIAIETIQDELINTQFQTPDDYHEVDADTLSNRLREVVLNANQQIYKRAKAQPEFKGMGTTLTMAFARESEVVLAHVGDSRAYLVDSTGDIIQLTADHSFVQALVDAGHITADEADDHPMKNVLYRALGQGDEVEVDIHFGLQLRVNDSLILCSDGLTLHVKPYEIADIVAEELDPDMCSQKLVDLANDRGGKDNISVIVIKVEQNPLYRVSDEEANADTDTLFNDGKTVLLNNKEKQEFLREHNPNYPKSRISSVEIVYSESDREGRDTFQ